MGQYEDAVDMQLVEALGDALEHNQSSSAEASNGAHSPDGEIVPTAAVLCHAGDENPRSSTPPLNQLPSPR
eukprot:3503882-Prorocentrum_lima.AAC.1